MARATGPERRLLAIYTGGTIGMRSEGGGESVSPSPKQNSLRAGALGTQAVSGKGRQDPSSSSRESSGGWESKAQVLEGVRGMVTLPDLKYPRSHETHGPRRDLGRLLCSVPGALGRMLEHSTPSSL